MSAVLKLPVEKAQKAKRPRKRHIAAVQNNSGSEVVTRVGAEHSAHFANEFATLVSKIPDCTSLTFGAVDLPDTDMRVASAKTLRFAVKAGLLKHREVVTVIKREGEHGLWLDNPVFKIVGERAAELLNTGFLAGLGNYAESTQFSPDLYVYPRPEGLAIESGTTRFHATWIPPEEMTELETSIVAGLKAICSRIYPYADSLEEGVAYGALGYGADLIGDIDLDSAEAIYTAENPEEALAAFVDGNDQFSDYANDIIECSDACLCCIEYMLTNMGRIPRFRWYTHSEFNNGRELKKRFMARVDEYEAIAGSDHPLVRIARAGLDLLMQEKPGELPNFSYIDETYPLGYLLGVGVGAEFEEIALDSLTDMSMQTGEAFIEVFDIDAKPLLVRRALRRVGLLVGYSHAVAAALNEWRIAVKNLTDES